MNGRYYPSDWEIIKENLRRLRVPGGWLVHNSTEIHHGTVNSTASESMIFFSDQYYEWVIEEK